MVLRHTSVAIMKLLVLSLALVALVSGVSLLCFRHASLNKVFDLILLHVLG